MPPGSLQVTLFANIYLSVAVTGNAPKSNQLESIWLSPTSAGSYFCPGGHLCMRQGARLRGDGY